MRQRRQDSGGITFFEGGVLMVEFWELRSGLLLLLPCMSSLGERGSDGRWELCPANAYVLSFVGAFFSMGCFYLIANTTDWQPFGRFILLTYNLVRS